MEPGAERRQDPLEFFRGLWRAAVTGAIGFVFGWSLWSVIQAEKLVDGLWAYALVGAFVGFVFGILTIR